jgi:formimidoylglutamate deiminase
MYRFVRQLQPDDIAAIAAFVQMETLEAGYATICEFHYLHHQLDGRPYDNIGELAAQIARAANESGIGLTLLPVLYQQGGCDGRPLAGGQLRFGNSQASFARLIEAAQSAISTLHDDSRIGVAVHSLRAVNSEGLDFATHLLSEAPLHIHIAEQKAEIDEVLQHTGKRPVEWLLENHDVDQRWCLIHATHMKKHEIVGLAITGAVAGLCPITEANLGDGIFEGQQFLTRGGQFGIGSDSNTRISLSEELRMLEYSQRLRDNARAVLAEPQISTGRVLFEGTATGGAQAAGRNAGTIEVGKLADLMALDGDHIDLFNKEDDTILDSFIFAGRGRMVREVWSAGRHVVKEGVHIKHDAITTCYRETIAALKDRM